MMKLIYWFKFLMALALIAVSLSSDSHLPKTTSQGSTRLVGPTSSQPLALSADDQLLVVANTDIAAKKDAGRTINMHLAVSKQTL